MDTYYVLIPVPVGLLILSSSIVYALGLRIINSIGLGTLLSLISIIILHRFKFDENNNLIYEGVDLYVSIYIISCIIILIILICYLIIKHPSKKCCCKESKGPEYLYQDNDGNGIDSIDVHPEPIEPYNDLLESSTKDIPNPNSREYSNSKIIKKGIDYNSYDSKSIYSNIDNIFKDVDTFNNEYSQSLPNEPIIKINKDPILKIKRYNKEDIMIIKSDGISISIENTRENDNQDGLLYDKKKGLKNLDSDTDEIHNYKRGYNSD